MKFLLLVLILFLQVSAVLAQEGVALIGKVVDKDEKGLKDVEVSITGFNSTYTTSSGQFEFKLPPSKFHVGGNVLLHCLKNNYQPKIHNTIIPADPLKNPILITMQELEEIIIVGQVLSEENKLLENVQVSIAGIGSSNTSSNGEFRFILSTSKFKVGDIVKLLFSKYGWELGSISYTIPANPIENPIDIKLKKLIEVSLPFKEISGGLRSLMPGWGQFHKGQYIKGEYKKGWIFIGLESALLLTAYASLDYSNSAHDKALNASTQRDRDDYNDISTNYGRVSNISWILLGITHVVNMLDSFSSTEIETASNLNSVQSFSYSFAKSECPFFLTFRFDF